jgi:hypothetical protein
MKSHRLPFENRWTNSAHAWEWNCELDELRAMFADHEVRHPGRRAVIFDFPAGFVRDWLAFEDRRAARNSSFGALPSLRSRLSQPPRRCWVC